MDFTGGHNEAASASWRVDAFRELVKSASPPDDAYEFHEEDRQAVYKAMLIAGVFGVLLLGGAIIYFSEQLFGGSLITLAVR